MTAEEYMKIKKEMLEDVKKEIEEEMEKALNEKLYGDHNIYYYVGLEKARDIVHLKIVSEPACLSHSVADCRPKRTFVPYSADT